MPTTLTQTQIEILKMFSHEMSEQNLEELRQALLAFRGGEPANFNTEIFDELKDQAMELLEVNLPRIKEKRNIPLVNLDELPREIYNAIMEERQKSGNKMTPAIMTLLDSFYYPSGKPSITSSTIINHLKP